MISTETPLPDPVLTTPRQSKNQRYLRIALQIAVPLRSNVYNKASITILLTRGNPATQPDFNDIAPKPGIKRYIRVL